MTCREVFGRMTDLFSGELAPGEARESKRHLARCESCAGYWRSYRRAVALVAFEREASRDADPPEMPEPLVASILAAARTLSRRLPTRAWRLVHLLAGIAAAPIVAFALR